MDETEMIGNGRKFGQRMLNQGIDEIDIREGLRMVPVEKRTITAGMVFPSLMRSYGFKKVSVVKYGIPPVFAEAHIKTCAGELVVRLSL
jgi:hypothetical protein